MDNRRFLRPLPLLLIFLFVGVAIGDLIQKLTEEPPPPPEIAGSALPHFETLEPVIDFRLERGDPAVEILPLPELVRGQWSAPKSHGVWTRGAAAELWLEFATGGHRHLILECLPASGKRPVRSLHMALNGLDLGGLDLLPGWHRYHLAVPEGAVRPGSNRIVLHFPDRDKAERPQRALLIRKLGWFFDENGAEGLNLPRPVSLALDDERVIIRRSGILEIPIVLDERTDALQMRYRFSSGAGRAELAVEKSGEAEEGLSDVLRAEMGLDEKTSGRIRVPLHGRRGAYVIRIRADLETHDSRLLISSLRLVEEGDPTRRPWAASSPPS
jgi:hypothetical protein